MRNKEFGRSFVKIALPVTLQALLQASFGLIDQIMIGKLGKYSIAGIGFAGKFISIFSVVLAAVTTVAGIMISQYLGKCDKRSVRKSFAVNFGLALGIAALFVVLCAALPSYIMSVYTKDGVAKGFAAQYLRIMSVSLVPTAIGSMLVSVLRCNEKTVAALVASILSLALNAVLNYLLIFGIWVFPELGVKGAAWATVISQSFYSATMAAVYLFHRKKPSAKLPDCDAADDTDKKLFRKQFLAILCPILICELMWTLGENVYAVIYGNIGTDAAAAMTITAPVQTMTIGALSGLSQAAAILIGKYLGAQDYEQAYSQAGRIMRYEAIASLGLSALLCVCAPFYPKIYGVSDSLRDTTRNILFVFAAFFPVKTANMVLGGGIIRSGGKTKYMMWIDMIGTWGVGVPLGLIGAFAAHLDIEWVYMLLSIEECVRLAISAVVFEKKIWMKNLK